MMGSHVDSVPTGGRYDGQLGVLCGLEVIRTLNDTQCRTRHPVTLAIFTNEEGARFQPAMIASGVMAGKIALEDAYNTRDKDGIRLVDELERIGYLGSEPCVPRPFRAYLELHIEQGPFLEEEGLSVGVVEGIVAIAWSRLTIHGVQDHAGPTPMRIRHDAVVAAAEVISGVRRIAREIGGELVTTVGNLVVAPNIVNAIPGRVTLSIDMRDPSDATLDRARARWSRSSARPASAKGCARARALLARAVHAVRPPRGRHGRARRPGGRRAPSPDPIGRRPRRPVHGGDRADGDGLRAVPRRTEPLRGRIHRD